MDAYNFFNEQLVQHLWAVSWQVSILIGLIWIVDKLAFRASSIFRYLLWCIVLVRLCIPVNLTLPVDIEQFFFNKTGIDVPDINSVVPFKAVTDEFRFKTLPLNPSIRTTLLTRHHTDSEADE